MNGKIYSRASVTGKGFLNILNRLQKAYDAVIHIFCLMDTHYHLLLETPSENLPQIMRHINGAYTTYFNVKRGRSGVRKNLRNGCIEILFLDISAKKFQLHKNGITNL